MNRLNVIARSVLWLFVFGGFLLQHPDARAQDNYRIHSGDLLSISVFRQPDLSVTLRVANDGSIEMPLAGHLHVSGLSIAQAGNVIRAKLAAGFVPNPQVTVNVTEFSHRRFTVLGQVTRSGTYDFPDEKPLDLLQAIGLAGGYTNIANSAHVTIRRVVRGATKVYQVNAKKLAQGKLSYEVQIEPGDVITVAESIF
jgi:protein involved in polysaccharide export with SLBB domain